jgi:hypothetical protein
VDAGGVRLSLLLGVHPLGDVDAGAAHPDRAAGLVLDDLAVGRQVPHLTVGPDDPFDHLVGLAGGVGPLVNRLDPVPVVGMHHREELLVGRRERPRLVAVDAEELVRPGVDVGRNLPVVVAHVGELLGVVDARLQVAEGFLRGLPVPERLLQALARGVRHSSTFLPRAPVCPPNRRKKSRRDVRDDTVR